jgi:O-antigen ligase
MFLTFSRGGWVSLFISLLLFLILIIKRNRNSIILVLLCISLIATIVTITLFTTTKEIYEITDLGSEITSLDTLFVRIQSSIDSINHLLRNKCILLSGYGFYLSYSPMSKIISKTTGISYIHNTYIYAVAEMGLPFTLLLFITILVGAFKDVSNIHRKKYLEERKMNFALISIVIGFLIRISTEVIWPAFDRWTQIWFLFILIFSIMSTKSGNEETEELHNKNN